jgi:hypothetical protein
MNIEGDDDIVGRSGGLILESMMNKDSEEMMESIDRDDGWCAPVNWNQ